MLDIICFGEALWDIFSDKSIPGGAPMNVAYHCSKAGIACGMISKVGDDDLGHTLRRKLEDWGIDIRACEVDPMHPTGTVIATIDENNEPHYTIVEGVAWDHIHVPSVFLEAISQSQALVYGSLACRNEVSRQALLDILPKAPYRVFDINLRPPFYSGPVLEVLLQAANLVKLNAGELKVILELIGNPPVFSEEDAIQMLMERYQIREVIVTKGKHGASYYMEDWKCHLPIVPVHVKDTVGSGDAFLAGFLSKKVLRAAPKECLIHAIALSAFVTSKEGACPDYSYAEFEEFKEASKDMLEKEWQGGEGR